MPAITRPSGFGYGIRRTGSFAGKEQTEVATGSRQHIYRPIAYRNNPAMPWLTRVMKEFIYGNPALAYHR